MKQTNAIRGLAFVIAAFAIGGCGPSKEEIEAQERARLELERKALQEADQANKAITDINKSMFSRMNSSTTAPKQPAEQEANKEIPPPEDSAEKSDQP